MHVHPFESEVAGVSCLGMSSVQGITAPSVSWMLVDMLTWTAKPGSASSANSTHCHPAEEDCRAVQCTLGTGTVTDSSAFENPAVQPQVASEMQQTTGCSSYSSRALRGPESARQQQKCSDKRARRGTREASKLERHMAGHVHIVRPSALRRSASCPEEAARPGAGESLQHSSPLACCRMSQTGRMSCCHGQSSGASFCDLKCREELLDCKSCYHGSA